jgi:hypothetical protein
VSWRRGNEAVGWAPLPPEGEGYAVNVEVSATEPPRGYWHFVPAREFLAPDLEVVIIHDEEPFEETELVGPVIVENNIVVNNVIEVNYIQEATGQQVETTRVEVVKDPTQAQQVTTQGTIVAVEGQLAKPAEDVAPPKAVETQAVQSKEIKAPTVGQQVETTSSVKPTEQQPNGEATPGAGQATGGQQAQQPDAEQPKTAIPGTTDQQKAAKGTTGEDATQPGAKPVTPEEKAAKGETGEQQGETAAKPKVEKQQTAGSGDRGGKVGPGAR